MEETIRVDPSVHSYETDLKGEPRGSVPLERTIRKPEAYSKPSKITLPKDSNP